MWFTNDVKSKKSTLYGSETHHQQQQVTVSSRLLHRSKSYDVNKGLSSYQNYCRFEIKCGNMSFVYEKNINRAESVWVSSNKLRIL